MLTSSVLNAEQVGTNVIRAKREPQHFLGVIIESALTGQHHGFGIYYCSQMQQLSNNINIIMLLRNITLFEFECWSGLVTGCIFQLIYRTPSAVLRIW